MRVLLASAQHAAHLAAFAAWIREEPHQKSSHEKSAVTNHNFAPFCDSLNSHLGDIAKAI
jgi:hypothetical protein